MGPKSLDEKVIEDMLKSGMNIARFNFSHGDHEYHKKGIEMFRKVRDKLKLPAAVLLDTKGPEIRIGKFESESGIFLEKGQLFTLTVNDTAGNDERVSVSYKKIKKNLSVGDRVLIDDGRIDMTV